MSIILLKPSNARQPRKGPSKFIPMQNSKISHPDRQLSIGILGLIEDKAMSWTVHRLQSLFFLTFFKKENVLLVFEIMTTSFPELRVIKIG